MKRVFSMGFILALFSYYFYYINELSASASEFDSRITKIGLVAQISIVSLYLLLVFEGKYLINFKQLYYVLPFFFILPFILYAWDPKVLTEHIPYIGFIFKLTILFNWIVLGFVMGVIFMYYLNSEKFQDNEFSRHAALRLVLVTGIGGLFFSILLSIILFDFESGMGVVHGIDNVIFPFNYLLPDIGEGTEGVIIIISIFFFVYLGARFIFPRMDIFKTKTTMKIQYLPNTQVQRDWKRYLILSLEVVIAFASVSAAFSIMGYLVHDGRPQLPKVSIDFILLSLLAPISLILLVSRRMILRSTPLIIKSS